MSVSATLETREFTHGDFPRRAIVEQALIDIMERADMWPSFEPYQRSAARMIAVKLSRLLSGNPDHADSWHDIAGYAQLAEETLASAMSGSAQDREAGLGPQGASATAEGGDAPNE
jgi:hypothetical protein